jgi:diguanylate cyclase (GGDEF)-like protein
MADNAASMPPREPIAPSDIPDRPAGRYVLALALIAVFAILSTLITAGALGRAQQGANVLEYGLGQGALSERVVRLTLSAAAGGPASADAIEDTMGNILTVHFAFQEGDEALGIPAMKDVPEVGLRLAAANAALEEFIEATSAVTASMRAGDDVTASQAAAVVNAADAYTLRMTNLVEGHTELSADRVEALQRTEYFLLAATVILLVLEALFLFRPAAQNIRDSWDESSEAHAFERELDQQRLNFLARYDPLTGLINRTLFADRLENAVAGARRDGSVVALMFLDIDGFKEVNDRHGHHVGDALLRQVAERLVGTVRESDTVARLGGDEFTVILEGGHRVEDAGQVATNVLKALSEPYRVGREDIAVTSSIGVAAFPLDGETAAELLKGADIAMYSAKAAGRNTYQFYTTELKERTIKRLALLDGLRRALNTEGELTLVYQPKVDVGTQVVIGLEALLRWTHPEFGPVPTGEFIALAEETDLVVPLGQWVADRACLQMREWLDAGLPPMRVSVNVSARQFRAGNLVETIIASLASARLSPDYLDVELTEGTLVSDLTETRGALERLQDLGVTVSLDDFGTGYSSLGYLTSFPIDTLKIDRSFVVDGLSDGDGIAVSSAIIGLAKTLGMEVLAEGVDSEQQLADLRALGCDNIQGFLIAKPLPTDQVMTFVTEYHRYGHRGPQAQPQAAEA